MKIYFVRHAQSIGNATNYLSTEIHDELSEEGLHQSQMLVGELQKFSFDKIYCSPLMRALQTVYPFAKSRNLKVEIWPESAEACWHEDRTIREESSYRYTECDFHKEFDGSVFSFRGGKEIMPIDHQTYSEGHFRSKRVLELLDEYHGNTDDTICIVGHGIMNSRIIELLFGLKPDGRFGSANTGITLVEGGMENSNNHLEVPPKAVPNQEGVLPSWNLPSPPWGGAPLRTVPKALLR